MRTLLWSCLIRNTITTVVYVVRYMGDLYVVQFADGWANQSPWQGVGGGGVGVVEHNIFERGCWRAGEEWVESNLIALLVVLVGGVVLQVLTRMFAGQYIHMTSA